MNYVEFIQIGETKLSFDPKINVIIGGNGVGKTMILEHLFTRPVERNSILSFDSIVGLKNPEEKITMRYINTHQSFHCGLERLSHIRSTCESINEKPSPVMLIDHIEMFLHPKLQNGLLDVLNKSYPKIQYIVTSHSPIIVAGRDRGQVITIEREK